MSFETLGLDASVLKAVADQGYTVPTPIQAAAIPPVLQGVDLAGARVMVQRYGGPNEKLDAALRAAERASTASKKNDPPRRTRYAPFSGPFGFFFGVRSFLSWVAMWMAVRSSSADMEDVVISGL